MFKNCGLLELSCCSAALLVLVLMALRSVQDDSSLHGFGGCCWVEVGLVVLAPSNYLPDNPWRKTAREETVRNSAPHPVEQVKAGTVGNDHDDCLSSAIGRSGWALRGEGQSSGC